MDHLKLPNLEFNLSQLSKSIRNIPPPSQKVLTITAASLAFAVPIYILGVLPFTRKPTPKPNRRPRPLPEGVERHFTPDGLELLIAKPKVCDEKKAPIFLQHGGFGKAGLTYEHWLPYFASKGRTVYALSVRGHGESVRPKNFQYLGVSDFANDLEGALSYVHYKLSPNSPPPVLLGHSAGGGLSQYTLATTRNPYLASGLICCGAYPAFGGYSVFKNWALFDPLFALRTIKDLGDPKSPVSHWRLTQKAFFSPLLSDEKVQEFHDELNHEESMAWAHSMMFRFADPKATSKVVGGKVFHVAGEYDALMTPTIVQKAADEYNGDMVVIEKAGHHMMNDVTWKEAADAVLAKIDSWNL